MKRVLCVLLSILLMLSLGTALAEGTEEEDWAGIAYSDIISEYVVALQEGWGPELSGKRGSGWVLLLLVDPMGKLCPCSPLPKIGRAHV